MTQNNGVPAFQVVPDEIRSRVATSMYEPILAEIQAGRTVFLPGVSRHDKVPVNPLRTILHNRGWLLRAHIREVDGVKGMACWAEKAREFAK